LLRQEPVFARFMAGLLPGAIVIGVVAVTNVILATEVFTNETGVATTAISGALAGAAAGLLLGSVVDRWNARWILIASMTAIGLNQILTFALYQAGALTPGTMIALAVADGFFIGSAITSLLTTQAGLVGHQWRGAAEITNALRVGSGAILGTLLATFLLPLTVSLAASGVVMLMVAGITAWTSRPFQPAVAGASVGLKEVITVATRKGPLRSILIVDAAFALILPTQLVNLFIVDKDLPELLGVAVAAGFAGVLAARLHLSLTGLRGILMRRVRLSYSFFIAVVIVSLVVLLSGSTALLLIVAAPLIVLGSWASTFSVGLVSATVQQQLPDGMRGRFTGALNAVRSLAIAAGVLVASVIITPQDTETFLVVLVCVLVGVFAVSRGFVGLRNRDALMSTSQ
jgi:MFS family permease